MIFTLPARVASRPQTLIHHLFYMLFHLGGFGLLALSFLDSSPLFMPLGNDLLLVALTASKHSLFVYYALMATAGSVLGCLTVDALSRKGGEKGLERILSPKRLNYIKRRIKKNAAWALVIASLVPPPFPFTGFVAAAAAFQYPRRRLVLVVFLSRLARFLIEGALGIIFGRRLLRLAYSPVVIYPVAALIVVSIALSAIAILRWARPGKTSATG